MSILTVNGAALAYDDEGDGPAVVLLHAGIADRGMWRPVAATLAAGGCRVIRYDLRGFGESALPAAPVAHHEDLAGLLDVLGVASATVVGCSFGGQVAIDTALAYPDVVSTLVLVNSGLAGHVWTEETEETWDALVGEVDEEDLDAMADALVRFWVVGPDRRAEDLDPRLLTVARQLARGALTGEASRSSLEVREVHPPAADRLSEVRPPTLIMAGAADLPAVRRIAERLAAQIPGAHRLPDVPDAAHLLPLEHPNRVATAVLDFLRTLPA